MLRLDRGFSTLAGSNVLTPFGTDSSFRINLPVSRPRSGIALAHANDSALATTTIGRYGIFIKSRNTVFPSDSHGKKKAVLGQFPTRDLESLFVLGIRPLTAMDAGCWLKHPWDLASERVLVPVKSGEQRALWRRSVPVTRSPLAR
jgi:hypothetical protein